MRVLTFTQQRCPICGAEPGGCTHELLRWSLVAYEYEPSLLAGDAQVLEGVLAELMRQAWRKRRAPDLPACRALDEAGAAMLTSPHDAETSADDVDPGFSEHVMESIASLPGVIRQDDLDDRLRSETVVLWAADPEAIRRLVRELRGRWELELARV